MRCAEDIRRAADGGEGISSRTPGGGGAGEMTAAVDSPGSAHCARAFAPSCIPSFFVMCMIAGGCGCALEQGSTNQHGQTQRLATLHRTASRGSIGRIGCIARPTYGLALCRALVAPRWLRLAALCSCGLSGQWSMGCLRRAGTGRSALIATVYGAARMRGTVLGRAIQ